MVANNLINKNEFAGGNQGKVTLLITNYSQNKHIHFNRMLVQVNCFLSAVSKRYFIVKY